MALRLVVWTVVLVAIAAAGGLMLLRTEAGAGVIAGARCATQWVTADRSAYQACFDVEREQILEERVRRRGKLDE